jgi:PAS domain S-box-containing protein
MQDYHNEDTYGERELGLFAALGERIALVIERQQTEEARFRLATAIEQTVDLVIITDAEGNIEYVNPAFERTTGYEAARLLGKNPRSLKSGQHDLAFYRELWGTITAGAVWSGNFVNRRADGSFFSERATVTPVRDSSGRIVNYVKVSRDVTAQLMLEAQLQQSQKLEAIGSLAAGIAHEINTPIQFIGNNTHFLSHSFSELFTLVTDSFQAIERTVNETPHPALLEILRRRDEADLPYLLKEIPNAISQSLDGIARVTDIVRAMREFSHPGTGTRSRVDVNRALEGALAVARSELRNVAEIVTDFESSLPAVECFPNEINQVFLNLLVNAAHAVADAKTMGRVRGKITVTTRRKGGWIEVAIADNGTGIPESIRDHVFDSFFTTKPIGQGTGQGLAIARNTIENKHGGTLRFETHEGEGTTFFVSLPMEPSLKEAIS